MPEVRLFEDARALESLRSSDFDAVSAYGEVLDNAIQADATHIRIRFVTEARPYGYHLLKRIAFGDDGSGMDRETLQMCLKLGWSSRYNNRAGIGRFGVGMTLGAIHECKRVDVWSKVPSGPWLWTYVDLDEVADGDQHAIPDPVEKPLPDGCEGLVGDEKGTLVLWSKYDRQEASAEKLVEDTKVWVGRTYRYFMWDDGLEVYVNGELVKAIDPLYARTERTRFPDDPQAVIFEPMTIEWNVDRLDAPGDAPEKRRITIRMSRLPEEFRLLQGAGNSREVSERFIPMNEGVSILRARREVFYGHIPYWSAAGKGWSRFEEIDRWWGAEIEFDPMLDRAFSVKNIKRGAVPETELKKLIHGKLKPTRENVLENVRAVWLKNALEKEKEESKEDVRRSGNHTDAEKAAKGTKTPKGRIDEGKDPDVESDKVIDRLRDQYDEQQLQKLKELFRAQPFTIIETDWRGPHLFEANHLGGNTVLEYNRRHPFWKAVYSRIDAAAEMGDESGAQIAREIKALLDLLIIAYSQAETRFGEEDEVPAGQLLEQLRSNLGEYLSNYVRTWLKEKGEA